MERTRSALFRVFLRTVAAAAKLKLGRRIPFLRKIYFAVAKVLRPGVAKVGPFTIYFHREDNAVSHALRNELTYEPFELELIAALLKPGDHAVDVGANIGLHTVVMSRACGESGRVLAIEPDLDNARLWRRNTDVNGCRNAELLTIAASDCLGTLRLFRSEENRGDHRVYDPQDGRASVTVSAQRLDALLAERSLRPKLFKIDVQGWEQNALAGAGTSLDGTHPFALVTEFWSAGLAAVGSSARAYLSLLASLELVYYEIDEKNRRLIRVPSDLAMLLTAPRETNLLGLRGIAAESLSVRVEDV